jgi:hypothetical protein
VGAAFDLDGLRARVHTLRVLAAEAEALLDWR